MTSPVMNRIGMVTIPVRDIEQARDWYCKILGVPADGDIVFGHLYFPPMDGTPLMLDAGAPGRSHKDGHMPTYQAPPFMFHTKDVHAAYAFMKENGVELVTDVNHDKWFLFKDPDGNALMVCNV